MTKEEKQKKRAEIIRLHGEPNSTYDEPNESRRLINALDHEYRMSRLAEARAKKSELNKLADDIPEEKKRELRSTPALPVFLVEDDLKPFDPEERKILLCYFEDMNQDDKSIADKIGVSHQRVTKVKRLPAVGQLRNRAYDYILKAENAMMIRKLQLQGDTKIVVELGKKYGNLEKDNLEITNRIKPIEDPELIRMLKEIADRSEKRD